jgi:hypothetical protein
MKLSNIDIGGDHLCDLFGEQIGGGKANALSSRGDQHSFPGQIHNFSADDVMNLGLMVRPLKVKKKRQIRLFLLSYC